MSKASEGIEAAVPLSEGSGAGSDFNLDARLQENPLHGSLLAYSIPSPTPTAVILDRSRVRSGLRERQPRLGNGCQKSDKVRDRERSSAAHALEGKESVHLNLDEVCGAEFKRCGDQPAATAEVPRCRTGPKCDACDAIG